MNGFITKTIIFASGLAVGSIGTWSVLKKYYREQAQDEIDSFKESYTKRNSEINKEKPDLANYILNHSKNEDDEKEENGRINYTAYSGSVKKEKEPENEKVIEEEKPMDRPYVISPNEFGEFDDYEKIEFTYYSDNVLVDEDDEEVEDFDRIIGSDALTHFGEYEDDSVYVRNDSLKCDYEILADQRTYQDVLNAKPYLKDDEYV